MVINRIKAGDISFVFCHVVITTILLFPWLLSSSLLAILVALYGLEDALAKLRRWLTSPRLDFAKLSGGNTNLSS
jgi:hypothetical protein